MQNWAGILRTGVFFVCCLSIAYFSGAFTSETRGENPDEPSHIVTGLMVHDYLTNGLQIPPMTFARDYYVHYPKVTLGHFPPLFYLEQALWTLFFPHTRSFLICLVALFSAAVAARTYTILEKQHGTLVAWCAALLLLTLPATAADTTQIMTEIPLGFTILCAMISFGKYLDSAEPKHALAFSLWSSASLLMKGTGLVLAPVPLLAVALTRKWELLRRPWFWLPAPIVLAIAGPWYLLAPSALHQRTAKLGGLGVAYWRLGLPPAIWAEAFGWIVASLALLGLLWLLSRSLRAGALPGVIATAASLVLCGTVFPFLVTAWETRHYSEVTAAFVITAVAGGAWLASLLPAAFHRSKQIALCAATVLLISWNLSHIYKQRPLGYRQLAQSIVSGEAGTAQVILVSASANGEGALISEFAQREPHPTRYVIRAIQLLADVTWMGQETELRFHTAEEVQDRIAALPIQLIVLDQTTPPPYSYGKLLEQAILAHPDQWQPWETPPERFRVFQRRGGPTVTPEELKKQLYEISRVSTI